MEYQQLIESRRSVRKYADRQVTEEQIRAVIRAAQEAPSWKNQQTARYYCILDKDKVNEMREVIFPSFNKQRTENAALIVTAFEKGNVGFDDKGQPVNEIGDGWGCYDLGLQNAYLILKAKELGLGTLIMGIRDSAEIRKILSVPDSQEIVAVLAVGYPDESPARPKRRELDDILRIY
ncbi:MAG: nitroreductase family protein [Ruminococcus sp.]|nr:nitroreductase family protein [Ruminococcus sp.]